MTVTGALSSFRELGEMSPHKRQWLLSCDETPLPRENMMPCRLLVTLSDLGECVGGHAITEIRRFSDGRQAAVDGQFHPVHEARIA